jgi:hypothetical protein
MDVYINSAIFSTATAVFEDESLTVKSPDGFYSDNTYYRRQQDGMLQDVVLCSNTTPGTPTPTVSTAAISNNTTGTSATSGGTVTDNGATISMKGVCWGTSTNPTISLTTKTENGSGGGTFTSNIAGLTAGQVYNVRAYATTSTGTTVYGSNVTFTATAGAAAQTVTTAGITAITSTTATSGGNVTLNGTTISMKGVCWSTSSNPTIADSKTTDGSGGGIFTSNIAGLTAGQVYNVRAYATNSLGQTVYGSNVTFTATAGSATPTVSTAAISNNTTGTTATSGGTVTTNGATVTMRGVCWGTSTNPTIGDSTTTDGSGGGTFTSNIAGLTAGQVYNVRAYAITDTSVTVYGSNVTFTATAGAAAQTVTTAATTAITSTAATSGGTVTANGATITQKGVCWSLNSNPTIADSSINNGSGAGTFTSSITGLTASTGYNIRAYATNSLGQTVYGSNVPFTTAAGISVPTVSTYAITDLNNTSARSGGDITNTGGAAITQKGVCWSEFTAQPTIDDSKTTDGSGSGDYTSFITLLEPGITYNVRAYATNSQGIGYATNTLQFTTTNIPYTVGQAVEGGIIAYILASGDIGYDPNRQHGLVAAINDVPTSTFEPDYVSGGYDITTSSSIGTGQANTDAIMQFFAGFQTNFTAKLCSDLQDGGYTDWYLPSLNELQKLYLNRNAIGNFITDTSGPGDVFYNRFYWSSTSKESLGNKQEWVIDFQGAGATDFFYWGNTDLSARAVRSF